MIDRSKCVSYIRHVPWTFVANGWTPVMAANAKRVAFAIWNAWNTPMTISNDPNINISAGFPIWQNAAGPRLFRVEDYGSMVQQQIYASANATTTFAIIEVIDESCYEEEEGVSLQRK
jgi:hypothetical protein